jgi:type IV pilus assembly protein PilC
MQIKGIKLFDKVSPKDRAFFIRQLAIMISSGIALANALNLISQQTTSEKLRTALRVMTKDIENGHPFSVAAARYPDIFDQVTLSMIKTGEASGQLHVVVEEMAQHVDSNLEFGNKVRNALLYPAFVVVVMFVVGILLTVVIIPRLTSIFLESNIKLPITTQILVAVSSFLLKFWYLIPVVIVGAVVGVRSYLATEDGRETLYTVSSRTPVVKTLIINSYLARFTRVLAMLIKSGVPFTEALRIVSESMGNSVWRKALINVKTEVERGVPLSAAMARYSIFPGSLTQMIAVGEQTGKLDTVLDNMATFYGNETDTAVKGVTTLIEPIVLLIVAVGVGFVVISVIVPIYSLANSF